MESESLSDLTTVFSMRLDLRTGKKDLGVCPRAPLSTSPALAKGALVKGSQDGELYCLGN